MWLALPASATSHRGYFSSASLAFSFRPSKIWPDFTAKYTKIVGGRDSAPNPAVVAHDRRSPRHPSEPGERLRSSAPRRLDLLSPSTVQTTNRTLVNTKVTAIGLHLCRPANLLTRAGRVRHSYIRDETNLTPLVAQNPLEIKAELVSFLHQCWYWY